MDREGFIRLDTSVPVNKYVDSLRRFVSREVQRLRRRNRSIVRRSGGSAVKCLVINARHARARLGYSESERRRSSIAFVVRDIVDRERWVVRRFDRTNIDYRG